MSKSHWSAPNVSELSSIIGYYFDRLFWLTLLNLEINPASNCCDRASAPRFLDVSASDSAVAVCTLGRKSISRSRNVIAWLYVTLGHAIFKIAQVRVARALGVSRRARYAPRASTESTISRLAEIRGYNANVKGQIDKYVGDAIRHLLSLDKTD